MEYIIMFVTHLFKTAHYWLTVLTTPELHPEIAYAELPGLISDALANNPQYFPRYFPEFLLGFLFDYLPAATQALFWQMAKIAEIYLSVII